MTPQETEHFAALRMHVAHLHNALKNLSGELDGVPLTVAGQEALEQAAAVIEMSEPDVRELLKEADRDNQLVQARAQRDAAVASEQAMALQVVALKSRAEAVVATLEWEWSMGYDTTPEQEQEKLDIKARIEELAKVLPA